MTTNLAAGRKDDAGKLRFDLLPSDALQEVVKVLNHGSEKYGDRNWEAGMLWSRPFGACMRHMWSWWWGEDKDSDSGLSHVAHAACSLLFLIAYERRGFYDFDNRENRNKTGQLVRLGANNGN